MVLLDSDRFLTELTKMYERNKEKGSVSVTVKRTPMRKPAPSKGPPAEGDLRCLVRAADLKHKISTVLSQAQYSRFSASYANLQKVHFAALKKREKTKDKAKKDAGKGGR